MEREWLARRLDEGRSIQSIADEAGKGRSTVAYWIAKHDLVAAGRAKHATRGGVRRERLESLIAADLSVRAIAVELGISATTVRYWLKRFGLETTPVARRREARAPGRGLCRTHGEVVFVRNGSDLVCGRCRAEAVTRWRRRAKLQLIEEAGGGCALCGYRRCPAALQFHHLDPAAKRFGVGSRGLARAMATLRAEAAKCVLLCANCHAEVEAGVAQLPSALPAAEVVSSAVGR